jgi:hypothetical protein
VLVFLLTLWTVVFFSFTRNNLVHRPMRDEFIAVKLISLCRIWLYLRIWTLFGKIFCVVFYIKFWAPTAPSFVPRNPTIFSITQVEIFPPPPPTLGSKPPRHNYSVTSKARQAVRNSQRRVLEGEQRERERQATRALLIERRREVEIRRLMNDEERTREAQRLIKNWKKKISSQKQQP